MTKSRQVLLDIQSAQILKTSFCKQFSVVPLFLNIFFSLSLQVEHTSFSWTQCAKNYQLRGLVFKKCVDVFGHLKNIFPLRHPAFEMAFQTQQVRTLVMTPCPSTKHTHWLAPIHKEAVAPPFTKKQWLPHSTLVQAIRKCLFLSPTLTVVNHIFLALEGHH